MWPALVVGNWQNSEQQPDGSTKTTTNYQLVFFGTCSTCYCNVDQMFKCADGINRGLHNVNDWFVKRAYLEAVEPNAAPKVLNHWQNNTTMAEIGMPLETNMTANKSVN